MTDLDSIISRLNAEGQEKKRIEKEAADQKEKADAERLRKRSNATFQWDQAVNRFIEYLEKINIKLQPSGAKLSLGKSEIIHNPDYIEQRKLTLVKKPFSGDLVVNTNLLADINGTVLVTTFTKLGDTIQHEYVAGTMGDSQFEEIVSDLLSSSTI